jgi:hypothetical protein
MKYIDLEKYYLCGIGSHGEVKYFEVGTYDKNREIFSFSNGSYSAMELHREPRGGNATYVISATPLQDIDDAGLLYKN